MARLGFTVEVEGREPLHRGFNELENNISDFTPTWKAIQPVVYGILREQFDTEGSAGASGGWQRLSPKYEQIKLQTYGDKPILQASGKLYESLTGETSDSIAEFGKTEAVFGTKLPYGKYHQRGSGNLPKREVISVSDKQKERLARRMRRSILDLIKRTSLKVE